MVYYKSMATTNIDLFRDHMIDLMKAHKFRDTNYVEDENGNTQECQDPISDSDVERMVDGFLETLREEVDEEVATQDDFMIGVMRLVKKQ